MNQVIPNYLLVPFGSLFSLLTIVGVVGNNCVIIAILSDRKMRQTGLNNLLLILAFADLNNILLNSVEWVPTVLSGRIHWYLADVLCPLCRYFEYFFLFASISTQIIISIERYIAIVHPMHARRFCTRRKAVQAVAAAWFFIGIFVSPYAYYHKVRRTASGTSCSNSGYLQPWWQHYKMAEFVLFYLLPCIVIVTVYSKIMRCLWSKDPRLSQSKRQSEILKTRQTVIYMLASSVAVNFVCYSPIQAVFISKSIFHSEYHLSYEFLLIFNALAMTCSAANPLLYTLFSMKFRNKIKSLFRCKKYSSYRVPLMSAKVRESKVYVSNYTTD